jgi:uncharacterized protein YicC (UPF0701 family)
MKIYPKAATELGASTQDIFRMVFQMPEVYQYESNTEELAKDWEIIRKVVQEAVEACNAFRIKEGEELATNLTAYIEKNPFHYLGK